MLHKEPPSPSGLPRSSDGLTCLVISEEKKNQMGRRERVAMVDEETSFAFAPIVLNHKHNFAKAHFIFCISRFPCCVLLTNENPRKGKLSMAIN